MVFPVHIRAHLVYAKFFNAIGRLFNSMRQVSEAQPRWSLALKASRNGLAVMLRINQVSSSPYSLRGQPWTAPY
jgi:hypothetical protein